MSVEHLEVMVEEPSTEAAFVLLLPKMAPGVSFKVHPHQGKADLLEKLPSRLRGYASWLPPDWRILVVVDRDDDDCEARKTELERMAAEAGLVTRSASRSAQYSVLNRLAIEELEAWYFGDWEAVRSAYPRIPATIPAKAKYRAPDAITGGTWEAFERVLQAGGYFSGGLRKIEAARTVAREMVPARNTSPSFGALRDALSELSARSVERGSLLRLRSRSETMNPPARPLQRPPSKK